MHNVAFASILLISSNNLGLCINKYLLGDYQEAKDCAYQIYRNSTDPIEKGKALICVAASEFEISRGNSEKLCEIYREVNLTTYNLKVDPVYSEDFKRFWENKLPTICSVRNSNVIPLPPHRKAYNVSYLTLFDVGIWILASISQGPGYNLGKSWINIKKLSEALTISAQSNLLLFSNHVNNTFSLGVNMALILSYNFSGLENTAWSFYGGIGFNSFLFWMPREGVYFKPLNLSLDILIPGCLNIAQFKTDIGVRFIIGSINRDKYASFNSIVLKFNFY